MSTGKILLGVLAGLAAGATLGILFAPDKGSATRRKISEKGEDYMEGLGEKFNELVEGVTQKFDALKKEANSLSKNGKAKAEEIEAELKSTSK